MNTMAELQSYLNTTTYDITFILIAYPFTSNKKVDYVKKSILIQHTLLKLNPLYTLTYQFLTVTSDEIIKFYLANVTTEVPYLVTYKKRYKYREPWWYPCKQVALSSSVDDIGVYIKYSLVSYLRGDYGRVV